MISNKTVKIKRYDTGEEVSVLRDDLKYLPKTFKIPKEKDINKDAKQNTSPDRYFPNQPSMTLINPRYIVLNTIFSPSSNLGRELPKLKELQGAIDRAALDSTSRANKQ